MTQRELLIELFDYFGIGYNRNGNTVTIYTYDFETSNIEEGGVKVTGYCGFAADFMFNDDGSFIEVSIWE